MQLLLKVLTLVAVGITTPLLLAADDESKTAMESKAPAVSSKATFFLIGGAADLVLKDFVKLAGGEDANIAIVTHASSTPAESGDDMQNSFTALGVKHTTVILPGSKVGMPKDTNAIYFCGGDQARLTRLLKDEPLVAQLSTFEGIIGGSSAGSMVAAPMMIARGMDGGVIRADELLLVEGLSWLHACVFDTHAGQRSRDTRSMAALALIPKAEIAIALDEDTAVYIKDGKASVYGPGHVRVFKRGDGFSSTLKATKKGLVANVKNALVSFYCEGDEFTLPAKPAAPEAKAKPVKE